jgi:NDP-sugar pyrophosphorylase family protein
VTEATRYARPMNWDRMLPGISELRFAIPEELPPWTITTSLPALVERAQRELGDSYIREGALARHSSAIIEPGATIKGPAIIGPRCFVASSALIRGGAILHQDCIIGPSCELKTSIVLRGSKLAHLNFVGDSILGSDVNVEAGAMIANYRNERADKRIRIVVPEGIPPAIFGPAGTIIDTGVDKFGALVGDHVRIGANAVIAPGAILPPRTIVRRLQLVDQGG